MFSQPLPASNKGIFSLDFSPTQSYPTHGGLWIRLLLNSNNYYEVANFDWRGGPIGADVAAVRRVSGGLVVNETTFTTGYTQGSTYPIKITFSTTQIIMEAFGQTITLPISGSISVSSFEVETGKQDAYYDNIKLEAAP
jgi:hypothetical protein